MVQEAKKQILPTYTSLNGFQLPFLFMKAIVGLLDPTMEISGIWPFRDSLEQSPEKRQESPEKKETIRMRGTW